MVNAREYRVVVIESLFCPSHFRNTLARVLFNHLNVRKSIHVQTSSAPSVCVGHVSVNVHVTAVVMFLKLSLMVYLMFEIGFHVGVV